MFPPQLCAADPWQQGKWTELLQVDYFPIQLQEPVPPLEGVEHSLRVITQTLSAMTDLSWGLDRL